MAASELATYRAQLKQVDAALITDAENEELLKLKADLQDVITLTLDLVKLNQGDKSAELTSEVATGVSCPYSIGDECQAVWSKDGNYYDAKVEEIAEDRQTCTVSFDGWSTSEVVQVSSLRLRESRKRSAAVAAAASSTETEAASSAAAAAAPDDIDGEEVENDADEGELAASGGAALGVKKKSRADYMKEREYRKNRQLKKKQRLKDMEEAREKEKNKWQSFQKKSYREKGGGLNTKSKKSIFATPDSIKGKVGVGTCNIGGQDMTKYTSPDKYQQRF
ncbi:survival of motor neuron-related-splicing factor 30-like [Sycon ciliatum]|uniref:survival of motor neuron-related-splicing factor 30-like n=1 Tax=Sycon ciliatum TaxID=27933 RepID=UPI0020AD7972|eukprot:scpid33779/ scgid34384/ Survival of motor neuron-related-splicing factor 30; Survival motor neuron domain-containing protein 1